MNIGLYFGSYNPVHIGHLIIAKHILNETILNEVWMVVSPQNPFKNPASLLNENQRFHLLQSALENETKIKASNFEFKLPRPSYTANSLAYLTEKYPTFQFAVIIGSDGFQNITKWYNADFILNNFEFYIYQRPSFPIKDTYGAKVHILEAPLLEISSTYIRKLIKEKKSIRYLVPEEVCSEIDRNNYYKN